MSTLTRITLGRLAVGGAGGYTAAGVIVATVAAGMGATVATPTLSTSIEQPLAISVPSGIIAANIQSTLEVDIETIQVEVDMC